MKETRNRMWIPLLTGLIWMSLVLPGNATTFTVTSLADTEDDADGVVTLREAINQANNQLTSYVIDCSNLTGTIDLVNDLPLITGNTRIQGSGVAKLAISGACAHRIFSVSGNTTVEIHDVTLKDACARGGNGGNGGDSGGGGGGGMGAALFVNHGKVHCENVEFIGNKVLGGAGGGWLVFPDYSGGGGGGGFAGDGYSSKSVFMCSVPGGDGGFLGEEGKGGRSSGDGLCALDGGFGGGGGGNYGSSDWDYQAGHGGFGGGGGATHYYGQQGSGGLFGGAGNNLGSGGGGAGLGGAIFVRENAKLVLINCSLTGNTAVGGSSPTSWNFGNMIPGNPGLGKGGAVFAMANAVVKVSNITFSGNTAGNPSASETPANFLGVQLDANDFYGTFQEVGDDTTAFPPSTASNWPLYR